MAKKGSTKRTGKDRKAERAKKVSKPRKLWEKYKVEGDTLVKSNKFSPKSPGDFLANHKNRKTCGKTGYTEFVTKSE
ncbi:30S ribosomal protein S27ae [archaeon]|nr:30S ribosomal protein S27ae [archaeon]|tara:strand:- start:2912 stop:3142 length:231 start_codon:yes stop_codon:yes gene_type:complete